MYIVETWPQHASQPQGMINCRGRFVISIIAYSYMYIVDVAWLALDNVRRHNLSNLSMFKYTTTIKNRPIMLVYYLDVP